MKTVPDFRSSNGLFSSLRKDHKLKTSGKQLFDISVYQEESTTSSFHDMVRSLSTMANEAAPTLFHHLLARLAREDRLKRLYTQNVDEIDTSLPPLATKVPLGMKAPWPRTIQLHGGLRKMVCQKCRHTSDLKPERFHGPCPPLCDECQENEMTRTAIGQRSHGVGKLRPRIVLYNEHSPDEEAIGSVVTSDLRARPDCLIVVGTSLKIPGVRRIVREMSRVVRGRKDGVNIWINQDSMPVGKEFADCWDLVIKGDCDEVARHARMKKWDDDSEDICDVTASEVERMKEKYKPTVEICTPSKKDRNGAGIPTPSISNDEASRVHASGPPIPMKPLTNPASLGPTISEVLGQETDKINIKSKARKPAAPKKAPQRKKKQTTSTANDAAGKINQKFRVGKSVKTSNAKPNKSYATIKDEEPHRPMGVVSPVDYRSNTLAHSEHKEEEPLKTSPVPNSWENINALRPPHGMEMLIDGPEDE